jgi:type VI protein secretion system component VasF
LRLSRILRPEDGSNQDETIPLRRVILWVLVWVALLVGVALYFKYARLLTPLLG